MAASQLEEILSRLLVPDNEVIKQATRELQMVYKDAGIVYPLCEVMLNSQNPQVRQYAAVVLRKKLVKVWTKLSAEDKRRIKDLLLQSLSRERITIVLRSVAHMVSTLAKHELSLGQWSELIDFIMQSCNSTNPSQKEIGMVTLSALVDAAAVELQSQFKALLQLFSAALDDTVNKMVPFYALKSLTCMVEFVGTDELPLFQSMIPKIMAVIKTIVATDEEKACEAMELFDELVECDVAIVTPHLLPLIQFCLELASSQALGSNLRVKGLSFVSWLVTLKKKSLLRHGLLPNILTTMLKIMATPGEDDEDDSLEEESSESQSPITLAGQVLDVLSLNLPPDRIYPPVMKLVEPLLQSSVKNERSAALVAVAVITEGCADYIRKNHVPTLLQIVYNGVKDSERLVRNSALFALGQFAEHLQPDISQYHGNLLPVLIQFMEEAVVSLQLQPQEKTGITKIFYALETFCEHLGQDLVVYLPTLVDKLFYAISNSNNKNVQELVLSAFGAVANACQGHMAPYFSRIVDVLNSFIYAQYSQEKSVLQSQAVDTLGTLARTVGEETFRPLARDCVAAGKSLMMTTDPDLRRSVYGLFASVSGMLKEEMAPHLEAITQRMMESLTSDEGVKVHYASFQVDFLDFDDEESEGGASQDEGVASIEDDEAIEGFSVENAYLEEKEDTCNALGEMAENVGAQFLPYLDHFYKEVDILSEHQSEGIRKAAMWTLGKLCLVWCRHVADDDRENVHYLVNSTLSSFAAVVRTDGDKTVVVSTLETLEEILKPLKILGYVIQEKEVSNLMVSIQDVLDNKAQCQGDGDEGLPGEEGVAEYDSYLEEAAGTILGPLAALAGGEMFLTKFEAILPRLLKKLKGVNATVSDKSFAIGTLAEIVEALEGHARLLVSLYQPFLAFSGEEQDDEVCSNSVFGLGALAKNALPEMAGNYSAILQHLFTLSRSEKSANGRLMDNICGALCRMIEGNQGGVPLDQVLPLLLRNLPLKEDLEENATVYNCLVPLFSSHGESVLPHLQQLLPVIALELSPASRLTQGLQLSLVQLLQQINSTYPDQVQVAGTGLSQDQLLILTTALQHDNCQQTF